MFTKNANINLHNQRQKQFIFAFENCKTCFLIQRDEINFSATVNRQKLWLKNIKCFKQKLKTLLAYHILYDINDF